MTCNDTEGLLGAYSDGELDLVRTLDVEAHVRECSACAKSLDRLEALHTAVSAQAPYYPAPPELRRRLAAQAAPKEWWRHTGWQLAVAACLVAAVVIWKVAPGELRPAGLEKEVVAAHVRSLLADHLMDVPSTDRHTVKPWFTGKLDFAPEVEDLSANGFTLVGGRLDYLDGRAVAALIYRARQHTINVFTWPSDQADRSSQTDAVQGFHTVHWVKHGATWWAVSDLAENELRELANLL